MDRKRKLPPRAASRIDHVSKKRTMTPDKDSTRSENATTAPVTEPPPPQDSLTHLPTSTQPGKPLPTLGQLPLDDISTKDYQDYKETGVMAESLNRSRQKWIAEGLFEKYWVKPTKKKGVVIDDVKNPAKDSMFKLGQVTICIEPHVFEATMFGIKDPKAAQKGSTTLSSTSQQHLNTTHRPILQYGPPNGTMPSKPAPTKTRQANESSQQATVAPVSLAVTTSDTLKSVGESRNGTSTPGPQTVQKPALPVVNPPPPNPGNNQPSTQNANPPAPPAPAAPGPASQPMGPATTPAAPPLVTPTQQPTPPQPPCQAQPPQQQAGPKPPDPVIVMLAERASSDDHLREMMKKVAENRASLDELAQFQQVIDQITASQKKPSPPADRVIVDGRSVKYFADEVNVIIGVVLRSNPTQRAADLRPPNGSDPLVVALVKDALDKPLTTRAIISRIANGQPRFMDPQDLKSTLEELLKQLPKPRLAAGGSLPTSPATSSIVQTALPAQASRAKLPSTAKPIPDISGVVFEFAGSNGDRYLFPRFSIVDPVQGKPGGLQHVVASFLIVRKGSFSEYGGDPDLDYYQPVTIRISSQSGRHLESLARVVAPENEVRRYMDDIMDNMTRAEYILLAMRLPRPSISSSSPAVDKDDEVSMMALDDSRTGTPAAQGASRSTAAADTSVRNEPANGGVLWGNRAGVHVDAAGMAAKKSSIMTEEQERMDKYQKLINSAAAKDAEVA
ncbi:hypothetical protein CFIMG_004813RA [Ceratocystis fimbriata CBS 114723]|uniref:SWR1-complex protein 3 domain-containing protein n=1 Tax=Ceratocystis fimbriata CBS 114723 TaxID=1035309 RepID=A0A2C5X4M8_9PEZI|nr:hypothetical protein CFIMG_004813RA [Ceratocystis fimbriata CBS 114723]